MSSKTKAGVLETSGNDFNEEVDVKEGPMDGHEQEVVILVVGKDTNLIHGVVKMLTEVGKWDKEKTRAKVQICTSRDNPRRVIVETTPLPYIEDKSPVAFARRWISQNSLRRIIFGKLVLVVCVVSLSITTQPCFTDSFSFKKCWVDTLQLIFSDHQTGIMTLVKTEGNDDVPANLAIKKKLQIFVRVHLPRSQNIIYSNFMEGDRSVVTILNEIVGAGNRENVWSPLSGKSQITSDLKPFRMKEVTSKTHGPWSPETVILFGKTGSGKSTLAQMLTRGKLSPDSDVFAYSSGVRGGTSSIETGEGRGWYVVDTPGLGEPKDLDSTVETDAALAKFKKYVKCEEGFFAHYLFVTKKGGRVDLLEHNLWDFFKKLFGTEIGRHFSIVISDADQKWLAENIDILKTSFEGCRSFLCAEFPGSEHGASSEEREEDHQFRMESLKPLEYELARLERTDVPCKYGKHSKVTRRSQRNWANADMSIEKDRVVESFVRATDMMFAASDSISLLGKLWNFNDRITLEPLV